jgi:hypothetical protein
MNDPNSYPLSWPIGRPRTPAHKRKRSAFSRENAHALTLEQARRQLEDEFHRLGVRSYILSTNVELRRDGHPYSNRRAPDDVGVAVYFDLNKRPTVLACDKWDRIPDNIRAIVKHIDALRGQDRWGVGTIEQAFAGYAALPPPIAGQPPERPWPEVLGVTDTYLQEQMTVGDVRARYRALAREIGTTDEAALLELNLARDAAIAELEG